MKQSVAFFTDRLGISEEDVQQAFEIQNEKGHSLVKTLAHRSTEEERSLLQKLGSELLIDVLFSLPSDINTDFTATVPIAFLKKHIIVPVTVADDVFIALNDPFDFQAVDELRHVLKLGGARLVLCPKAAIISAINFSYDMTQNTAEEVMQDIDEEDTEALFSEIAETGDLLDDTSDSPVIRLVNLMFSQAVRDRASDIHIEPYQNSLKIRQRLDGILYDMLSPPKHVQSALISRIKVMANLNIAEKRLPQDGRIELRVGNKEVDIRVSTLPTSFGERVVLRLLDKSSVLLSLTDLGMPEDRFVPFTEQIHAANGIVLVTGPTGSGKTTTLYAALTSINNTDINIITVEDPVEYRISGIGQVQINPKINLTFASGLRSILRQDPDVILVGEIRDTETAEIAIQSALTGHLVFSTLHTNDSASAITRLIDMGIEPFLIASSVNAILAQRLVRIICPDCKESYVPDPDAMRKLGFPEDVATGTEVFRGKGCTQCHFTGFKGRCGIYELLLMNPEMKNLVLNTANANEIREQGIKHGLITLRRDGADKVLQGITTIEEVFRVSQE